MASISTDSNGNRTIQFAGANKKRRTVRLGDVSLKHANEVKRRIELLNKAARLNVSVDPETLEWLAGLGSDEYGKLAKVGLTAKRTEAAESTLGAFIDGYLAKRTDIKIRTRLNLDQVRRNLLAYFGAAKPLADITEGDADDWRLWMAQTEEKRDGKVFKRKLGENTVRRHCGRARQLFRAAVKRRLIQANPFAEMKGITVQSNKERSYFITRDVAAKVLEACPDAQWKLLFALSRFGGLRCPSEHLGLRWGDIDWEHGRMTVRSPKTERHEGKASRVVPIFPELKPHLDAVWDAAPEDAEFVITKYRDSNSNLRTQLQRIMARAGISAWPKLFQNLRSTRQTELAETFPAHVVCAWMGNSEAVAKEHYLQVTDEHFKAANGALQKALQATANSSGPDQTGQTSEKTETQETAEQSGPVRSGPTRTAHYTAEQVPPARLELAT
jgi:integrase